MGLARGSRLARTRDIEASKLDGLASVLRALDNLKGRMTPSVHYTMKEHGYTNTFPGWRSLLA